MKRFLSTHYIILLVLVSLITLLLVGIFEILTRPRVLVHPSLNLLEVFEDNNYSIKDYKKISYGFLPYWSIKDFDENYSIITVVLEMLWLAGQ